MGHIGFNPRAPCGARPYIYIAFGNSDKFQSTRPVRGATSARHSDFAVSPFQSTRPVRGATHVDAAMKRVDTLFQSTRPVRGATYEALKDGKVSMFQSTRPVRGATGEFAPSEERAQSFNPRAPCGARPEGSRASSPASGFNVSIHAPRAGRDAQAAVASMATDQFQSTRPVRGATRHRDRRQGRRPVSIHAPRAGRDMDGLHRRVGQGVSIHAPRAGRDHRHGLRRRQDRVSIHAPRAGRDGGSGANAAHMSKFQSTRPVRGATPEPSLPRTRLSFQSTRPVRGATCSIPSRIFWLEFQSTRPVRGATWT